MKRRALRLFLAALLGVSVALGADADGRFSQTLTTPELQETGMPRLNSDQVAVLDALVRRDLNARLTGRGESAPPLFSERLTAEERRIAGLAELSAAEVARVDAFVERYESMIVTRELLAPPVIVSRHASMTPREEKAERKIHGEFSLTFGWGSGGYSERTGSMVLHSEIAPGTHVAIGYSQSRIKGDGIYYLRDPYVRTPGVVTPPKP